MSLIRRVDCIEAPSGFLLTWDVADGATIKKSTVYAVSGARQFIIDSPLVSTGRCLISPRNYHLVETFKVSVVSHTGETETTEPISPRRLTREQRLILTDLRRRTLTTMKAAPIGIYEAKLLLRRLDGMPCELCGASVCSGLGGTGAANSCPVCIGTGISDPYYVYDNTVKLQGLNAADDQPVSVPEAQRSHKLRMFSTPFETHIRPGDLIVTGAEIYKVTEHVVPVAVGGVPVNLTLTTYKYEPDDERYKALHNLAYGATVND